MPGSVTVTISRSNAPAATARHAFCCEASANASCSSRVIFHLSATFSAVSPIDCRGKRSAILGFSKRHPSVVSNMAGTRRSKASSLFFITNGARVMLSTPPAITTSASPVQMRITASVTASSPEPHRRFTVTAGTSYGSPASSPAMRATLRLSSPAWLVAPNTT